MSKLNSIQYKALRICLGLRRTTPTNVILAEASEGPLTERFKLLTARYIFKIFSLYSHAALDKLSELYWYSTRKKRKKDPDQSFLLFYTFRQMFKYKRYIADFDYPSPYSVSLESLMYTPEIFFTPSKQVNEIKNSAFPTVTFLNTYHCFLADRTVFYTDASKLDTGSPTGFAFFSPTTNTQAMFKASSHFSIYSAEALAILFTLNYILDNQILQAVIFSDSKSVLDTLTSYNFGHSCNYIIYIIRHKLLDLKRLGYIVTLIWIPSHSGILGNETADRLAKNATTSGTIINDLTPHTDFYSIARTAYHDNSTSFLKNQSRHKGKQFFLHFTELQPKPWFYYIEADREAIVTCNRIRSNHYSLNASLFRCNIVHDSSCHCGHPLQDVDHILWQCPLFAATREDLIKQLLKNKIHPPFHIHGILKKPTLGVVNSIFSFIKKNELHI